MVINEKATIGIGDLLVISFYFGIIISIGLYTLFKQTQYTPTDYFLAGRHMFWLPVGLSLFASNIGSEHFIGLSGAGAASGIAVGAFEYNALILLQVLGFVFLPVYIASKVSTLPEYMKKRFGRERIRIYLAILSLMLYIFTKISVNLFSGALFIQQALRWNLYLSSLVLLGLSCVCTLGGGLKAVMYIDMVQVFVMIIGSASMLLIGLNKIGGWNELQKKYLQAIPSLTYLNPNDNSTCGVPSSNSWLILHSADSPDIPWPGFLFGQTPSSIWYWCADQLMVQKALSSKSLSHAQGATILTGWIKILPLFLIVIPGMISRVLFPDEIGCVDPDVCQRVCQSSVSCTNIAFPKLVLEIMPEGLRGLMISVMIAAMMSDLTSIFNSSSTLFTLDIYRHFREDAGSKELVLVGRICIVILIAISLLWIPVIQSMQGGQMYIYIQSIAAYLSPPIAVVFVLSITFKRLNEFGAFWALIVGLVLGVIRMMLDFSYPAPPCTELDTRPEAIIHLQVHYMYFATFLFFFTGVLSLVLSLLTEKPEAYRIIRTLYCTRNSEEPRADEIENKETEMENFSKNGNEDSSKARVRTLVTSLHQTRKQKIILRSNLALVILMALGFYIYFTVNPFTLKEIHDLQSEAMITHNVTVIKSFIRKN